MPEYVIAIVATTVLGIFGFTFRRVDVLESKVDKLEVKILETFVDRANIDSRFDQLWSRLDRFETKLDDVIFDKIGIIKVNNYTQKDIKND